MMPIPGGACVGSVTKSMAIGGNQESRSTAIGLAPVRVFNAVRSTLFSAAAELAKTVPRSPIVRYNLTVFFRFLPRAQTSSPPEAGVPSKSVSLRLNPQLSLRPMPVDFF